MNINLLPKFLRGTVFISYSHRDSAKVDAIVAILSSNQFVCWQDKRDLRPGDDFDDRIKDALRRAWTVIVFVSAQSIASKWALEESEYALAHRKRIVIVRLDDSRLPTQLAALMRLQWIRLNDAREIAQCLLSLLRKWRWQLRAVWTIRLVAGLALAAALWCSFPTFDQMPNEIIVESELLPAIVYCDGVPMQTLTPNLPRSTVEANGRAHVIKARYGGLEAEKRVQDDGFGTVIVLFSKEEFQ